MSRRKNVYEKVSELSMRETKSTYLGLLILFIVGALSGSVAHEALDGDVVVKKQADRYSYSVDEICSNLGYDLGYPHSSTEMLVECASWKDGVEDTKIDLSQMFRYVRENPEQFKAVVGSKKESGGRGDTE